MTHIRLKEARYQSAFEYLGEPGSRSLIPTPALICDLDLLSQNISLMATRASSAGYSLRPHVKSHKSAFVARRQLEAGAIGLSCAKLSEAEAITDRLISDGYNRRISILITSPIVGAASATRAAHLAERCDLIVVLDDPKGVDELAQAFADSEAPLSVLCDVDVGSQRTGVSGPLSALTLVDRIAKKSCLAFQGVQGYGGYLQHIAGRKERQDATRESGQRLQIVIDALENRGYDVPIRTGGGTGTAMIDIEIGILNELQPGSYLFMDREYRDALAADPEGQFQQSLTIATTVISANQADFVTVDAGLKAMATDAGPPLVLGHETTSMYEFSGDEHGRVTIGPEARFERGDRLSLVPPHCDPTVDRFDLIWLVQEDVIVGGADIDARGCSQ
jgi:D-serine deaminase-like pyridoxal phosphate-dependent protein